jgi:hypothetical protein
MNELSVLAYVDQSCVMTRIDIYMQISWMHEDF